MQLFGRRAHVREPIHLEALLLTEQGTQPALLQNLSVKGAKLAVAHAPALAGEVMVRWACYAAMGRVAWVEGSICGLEFDRQLDERVVAATLAMSADGLLPEPQRA
jgi:hypothetical protein